MVMRFFRKNFSVIIWAVVVVFIGGFVILSSMSRTETQRNIAFKVGKQQYTTIAFRERLDQTRRMLLNENREFNEDDLKKDILNSFVNEAVMTKFGVDMKIVVSGEDVQNYIQAQQSFQVNGSFSYDRYEDLLQRNGISMSMYESQVKLSLLVQQLSAMINNTNMISPLYMNEVGRMPSLDFEVKYVTVPLKEITEKISISDEGINKYYSEKMTDFFIEPEVKIGWAEMPIEVSQEDEDSLISQLEGIKKQITGNTITFETAAKAYSQGPSASKGGDLGWFDNDTMVDAFNKVVFKLKKGQISKPFQTKFGFHIVQKMDEKVENGKIMIQARHILLKLQVSDEQKDVVYNRALTAYSEMSQGAKIGDLFKSVNRTGLLSKETLPFKQMEEVFEFGEEDTAGYPFFLSEDEESEKKGRYVVYQVIEKKKGFYKPVAEVRDQIRQILEREKVLEYSKTNAGTLMEEKQNSIESAFFSASDGIFTDIFGKLEAEDKDYAKYSEFTQDTKLLISKLIKGEYTSAMLGDDIFLFQLEKMALPMIATDFNPDANIFFERFFVQTMFGEFIRYLKERYHVEIFYDRIGVKEEDKEKKTGV